MPDLRHEGSSTVGELSTLPLSTELLKYYRARLESSEAEMRGLESRIDACAASQAAQHKARWETLKRMDEITDLQKALSDSHIYLWEERENCQRLQAENDELRIQELEDRRKIQHLLSLVDPLVQDTTYVRDSAPETMTLHPHARSTTTPVAAGSHRSNGPRRGGGSGGGGEGVVAGTAGVHSDGTRVLRTVYMPNEQVDALLLTVESLRTQLQQQEQLGRERVAALLEDRRLRLAEERARRAAESDRAQEADATLEKTQQMLHQYTKDYLSLKHEGLTERRQLVERLEGCTSERDRLAEELHAYKAKAEIEMHAVNSSARSGAEQYIALYRQQVSDTERTMGLLKDQHNGLQQALAMRIKELEATVLRLKQSYRELDQRRALEVEGFTQEIGLMRKQVRRLELRLFGRKPGLSEAEAEANVPTPRGASAKVAHGAKALRAMQARVAALEKSLLTLDEDDI